MLICQKKFALPDFCKQVDDIAHCDSRYPRAYALGTFTMNYTISTYTTCGTELILTYKHRFAMFAFTKIKFLSFGYLKIACQQGVYILCEAAYPSSIANIIKNLKNLDELRRKIGINDYHVFQDKCAIGVLENEVRKVVVRLFKQTK